MGGGRGPVDAGDGDGDGDGDSGDMHALALSQAFDVELVDPRLEPSRSQAHRSGHGMHASIDTHTHIYIYTLHTYVTAGLGRANERDRSPDQICDVLSQEGWVGCRGKYLAKN